MRKLVVLAAMALIYFCAQTPATAKHGDQCEESTYSKGDMCSCTEGGITGATTFAASGLSDDCISIYAKQKDDSGQCHYHVKTSAKYNDRVNQDDSQCYD